MTTVTPKTLVQGQLLSAAAVTYYTVPGGTQAIINTITVCNTDSVTRKVTIHLIPSGGGASDATKIADQLDIEPHQTIDFDSIRVMEAGDFIQALADSANKISFRVDGSQLT